MAILNSFVFDMDSTLTSAQYFELLNRVKTRVSNIKFNDAEEKESILMDLFLCIDQVGLWSASEILADQSQGLEAGIEWGHYDYLNDWDIRSLESAKDDMYWLHRFIEDGRVTS